MQNQRKMAINRAFRLVLGIFVALALAHPAVCAQTTSQPTPAPKPLVILEAGLNASIGGPKVYPNIIVYDNGLVIFNRLSASDLYHGGFQQPYSQVQLSPDDLKKLTDSMKIGDGFFKATDVSSELGINLYSITIWQSGRTKTVTVGSDIFGETLDHAFIPLGTDRKMMMDEARKPVSKDFLRIADTLHDFKPKDGVTEYPASEYDLHLLPANTAKAIPWPSDFPPFQISLPSELDILVNGPPQPIPVPQQYYHALVDDFANAKTNVLILDNRAWSATFTCVTHFPNEQMWARI